MEEGDVEQKFCFIHGRFYYGQGGLKENLVYKFASV